MKYFIFTFTLFSLFACGGEESAKATTKKPAADSITYVTGFDVQPELKQTDSLVLLYFNDPYGDAKRYTRFFKILPDADTATISAVLSPFSQPHYSNQLTTCRSEGKVYLYTASQVTQTLFFSTKCDTCCYVYFIKNGNFYNYRMSEAFKNVLLNKKKLAKEPVSE